LSVVLEARQDLDGAVAALREASRLQPQAPDYPVRLGRIFLGTGRSAEAKEQFEKALKLDPDFEPARKGIEAVEESRPEPDGAP
jgi:tetratricopeptide (TPR) repeat protein